MHDLVRGPMLRRMVEDAANFMPEGTLSSVQDGDETPIKQVPAAFFILMFLTTIAILVLWIPVSYCLEHVIVTLAMVETPTSNIALSASHSQPYKPLNTTDTDDIPSSPPPPFEEATSAKPITSSIRRTIRHITSIGGFYARCRGFSIFFVYSALLTVLNGIFGVFSPIPGLGFFLPILILSPIHAGLTHAIIASPSSKSIRQRILPRSSYRPLALPALVLGSAYTFCGLTQYILSITLLRVGSDVGTAAAFTRLVAAFVILFTVVTLTFIPALVALVRVEASLLPDDEDTIVPFDRTYGGRIRSQVDSGSGAPDILIVDSSTGAAATAHPVQSRLATALSFRDALRSFDNEARIRLLKLYVKIFAISVTFLVVGMGILIAITAAFMNGEQMKDAAHKGIKIVAGHPANGGGDLKMF